MKAMRISFKDIGDNPSDTVFAKTFMNRLAVKKRIQNTRLTKIKLPVTIVKWEAADDLLTISWKYADTSLGEMLIGSTDKGLCFMGFVNNNYDLAFADLQRRFPVNLLNEESTAFQNEAIRYLEYPEDELSIELHLKGSAFQISIWEKLLAIPFGGLTTYSELAGSPGNARAAGSAVGANPICYILPCHRVVRSDGTFNGFYWGNEIKEKLLTYEAATSINEIIDKEFSNSFIMAHYHQN